MGGALSVGAPSLHEVAGGWRVTAPLSTPEEVFELSYQVEGATPRVDATPFLVTAVPVAMRHGWTLRSAAPVSAELLRRLPEIQDIYRHWIPGSTRIPVEAAGQGSEPSVLAAGRGAGSFFSGGVDSYYTLLKHRDAITRLIFVIGFDLPLHKEGLIGRVGTAVGEAAAALGVELIRVRTNLRDFCDRHVPWSIYHGAALASVALLLQADLAQAFIPSTHTYADMFPWGSHPLLDHRWSTEGIRLAHDGCEATRFEKMEAVAQSPVALQTLRVCFRNHGGAYNCGRCEKCLRTMVSLEILGALSRCTTFPGRLDVGRVAALRLGGDPNCLSFVRENLDAAVTRGADGQLVQALRQAMRSPGVIRRWRRRMKPYFRRDTYLKLFRPTAA